jgi:hypothetical protein
MRRFFTPRCGRAEFSFAVPGKRSLIGHAIFNCPVNDLSGVIEAMFRMTPDLRHPTFPQPYAFTFAPSLDYSRVT